MHPTHDPNTINIVLRDSDPLTDVIGDCDLCGTPDVARVLITGQDGWSNPRMVCANPAACISEPAESGETPASVLRSAAVYLQRHGWTQGAYYDPTATIFTPAADMVGAIAMVCYGGPSEAPAQHFDDPGFLDFEEAVLHLDRYLLVEDGTEAYEFNDAKGRTVEDVIRVLRDAAARPAEELIDALRAIDRQNADMAALSAMLIPGGTFAEDGDADSGPTQHEGCAHIPGTSFGCPACEEQCLCNDSFPHRCVRCFGGLLSGRFRLSENGDVEPTSDGGDVE